MVPDSPAELTSSLTAPVETHQGNANNQVPTVLSFDVEEHHRIEAAVGLRISAAQATHYHTRMEVTVHWLLNRLEESEARATFFIVGDIARSNPALVRAISRGGHEIGSHSWDHQRVHRLTPGQFRQDVRRSKQALEDVTGQEVAGYRAPTFSIVRQTGWAIDVLAEEGYRYDSSIFPIRHDRYGVPGAPRTPFLAQGREHRLLELPPLTWSVLGYRLPVAGGGYFRLFPQWFMKRGILQMAQQTHSPLVMLYFHPWEFDTQQQRLPLGRLNCLRTYHGIRHSAGRLAHLMMGRQVQRAVDVVERLQEMRDRLPVYAVVARTGARAERVAGETAR